MMTIEDLSREERMAFFHDLTHPHDTKDRRQELADRFAIQCENFDYLIMRRIQQVFHKADIRQEVARWAIGLFNPQKVAVNRIAVGYKRRPLRRIKKNKAQSKLLNEFYRRIRFGMHAPRWHRLAVATNRAVVLAKPLRDRKGPTVGFQVVTGSNAEVIQEPGTTDDHPPGILGVLLPGPVINKVEAVHDRRILTVDSRWFLTWGANGELLDSIEHDLGRFPGAWIDHNGATETDAFNGLAGSGMTKTTIEVGYIAATMGWTRKTQCRKLLSLVFKDPMINEDGTPEDQTLGDPEGVNTLSGEVQMIVSDLNVAVTNFLEQIDELDRRAFEQLTGAPAAPNPHLMANPASAAAQLHGASSEAHGSIVENLEHFEADIAEVAALMGRSIGMDVPDVGAVRDAFDAQFPPLPYLETPKERAQLWKERFALGVSDAVEVRAEIDGTTEEEAEARVIQIAERRAKLHDIQTKHQQPADGLKEPDPGLPAETEEQQQGRFGGRAKPPPPAS